MIVIETSDGETVAINVDRIERIAARPSDNCAEIFMIGGSSLLACSTIELLAEEIIRAKARLIAGAFALSGDDPSEAEALATTPLHLLQGQTGGSITHI